MSAISSLNNATQNAMIENQPKPTTVKETMTPPIAKKVDHAIVIHNDKRNDPYFWLRDKTNPDTIAYLEEENKFFKSNMEHTKDLQETLFQEMKKRTQENIDRFPAKNGDWYYYSRRLEGLEHPIYCRKAKIEDENRVEDVILDLNLLAKEYDYVELKGLSPSPDGKMIAYALDTKGTQWSTIFIKNLETGELLKDEAIEDTSGCICWANDGKSIWYVKINDADRPYEAREHSLGTPTSEDRVVFTETNDQFDLHLFESRNKEFILLDSLSKTSSETYYVRKDDPDKSFQSFQARKEGMKYSVEAYTDRFFVMAKRNGSNYEVYECPKNETEESKWTPFLEPDPEINYESIDAFRDHLVVTSRVSGRIAIDIYHLPTMTRRELPPNDACYEMGLESNHTFDTPYFRFAYESFTTPYSTYHYEFSTGKIDLKQREFVGDDFDPQDYITDRILITSRDGTNVPVSLLCRKDLDLSSPQPMLLYGYGSYGCTIDAYFSKRAISFADHGMIYAIAHIRGGGFLGEGWYEQGKLGRKLNTFNDFIDCAEKLIAKGITSSDKLAISGGSAGGLLMGAVINERPDLFQVVVAQVPFVDVLTTMLDDSLPLTTQEYKEWGNPNEKEAYEYMKLYSPYDNVKAQEYPAMLVTGGLHDRQVGFWEPAKLVAKLRDVKVGEQPLYLRTTMGAGHHSSSGRYESMREEAEVMAFVMDQLGVK